MSRRLLFVLALPCALHRAAPSASAQSPAASMASAAHAFGPFGPRWLDVDSITVGLASRSLWRGLDLGRLPLSAAIDLALWRIDGVQDRHTVIAGAEAVAPLGGRDDDAALFDLGGGYRYRLDTEDGELRLGAVARAFTWRDTSDWTSELAAAVQHRVDVPWTELRPLLALVVARDLDRFAATYLEPRASIDVGIPRDDGAWSVGGRVAVGTSLSDYAKRDGDTGFGHHATSAGLCLYGDRAATPAGPLLAELGLEHWWTAVDPSARRWVVALRVIRR